MSEVVERILPLGRRVVVVPESAKGEQRTKGGLVIPEQVRERPVRGTVDAVGDEVGTVKPGDVVIYGQYSGTEVTLGEQKVLVLHIDDVFGTVRHA